MKTRWIILPLLVGLLLASPPRAEEIPGADDPDLRAAVEAWLTDRDPRAALWAIGEIAANGNPAARLLARSLHHRVYLDFPDLSREERRALFPPDRVGKDSRISLYSVDRKNVPTLLSLGEGMSTAETPEEWIAGAEALLTAGFRETMLFYVSVVHNRRHLAIEATQYAETIVTDADQAREALWFLRLFHQALLRYMDDAEPERYANLRARWGGEPWPPAMEADFARALREERWTAIRVAMMMSRHPNTELPVDAQTRSLYQRWQLLTRPRAGDHPEHELPTDAEIEQLGMLLIRDAERTPFLRPLRNACDNHCPSHRARCVVSGLGHLQSASQMMPSYLQPIIGAEGYYSSWRAARILLLDIGLAAQDRGFGPDWLAVPQCLRDAASRVADRISPRKP